jgi:hypothetical protein
MISDQQLQANRKNALLSSRPRGVEYQPAKDGFVFSNDEIHSAIDRQQRLERASATDFSKHKPRKVQMQAA